MTKVKAKAVVKKTAKKKTVQVKPVSSNKEGRVHEGEMIVFSPVNPSQSFVVASEMADDDAIEAELTGKAVESYVYSFKEGGKTVTGLTVSGVNEMARLLTKKKDSGIKIRIVPDSIKIDTNAEQEGQKGISVILIAENMLSGETAIGAKFEPFTKKGGKSGNYPNSFALEKAVSKAERNAKRKLIPEKVAIEMINKFIKTSGSTELPSQPQIGSHGFIPSTTKEIAPVDYYTKLITMIAKECNVKIINGTISKEDGKKMIEKFNDLTGSQLASFKLTQDEAKGLLFDLLNCPVFINKK